MSSAAYLVGEGAVAGLQLRGGAVPGCGLCLAGGEGCAQGGGGARLDGGTLVRQQRGEGAGQGRGGQRRPRAAARDDRDAAGGVGNGAGEEGGDGQGARGVQATRRGQRGGVARALAR
jgi:hypothetical protein